jgi:hypothetical protein
MGIHIALNDFGNRNSGLIGAFSSDEKAMAACQENADSAEPLVWRDMEAEDVDGSKYVVVLVDLDVPLG